MRSLMQTTFAASLLSTSALAVDNPLQSAPNEEMGSPAFQATPTQDRAFANYARSTNLTIEQVKDYFQNGCSSGFTYSMRVCAAIHAEIAETELNDAYKELVGRLKLKRSKVKLQSAQRAWIKFRDLTCEYESDGWAEGSGGGMLFSSCRQSRTEERTETLLRYIRCADETCPEQKQK